MPNLMWLICKETQMLLIFTETFYSPHIKYLVPTTITNKTSMMHFNLMLQVSANSHSFFRQVVVMPQFLRRLRKQGRETVESGGKTVTVVAPTPPRIGGAQGLCSQVATAIGSSIGSPGRPLPHPPAPRPGLRR